jgi:transposase
VLGERLSLMLVNARHIKQVPGRKTDVKDCQWIAQLLQHGLLKASFVPERPLQELRDLTRQRAQLTQEKARVANRLHKTLEDANIKLASVASDVLGVSGRKMIRALIDGDKTPQQMADLALRKLREKVPQLREALDGKVTPHHRFMLGQLMGQVEHLEGQVEAFDQRIEQVMRPFEKKAVGMLDKVPGIDARAAQDILAEIGTDMGRFPSAAHLASWAGMCPGNNASAGKRKSGRTTDGDRWLKRTMTQSAWAASRTKGSYYQSQYRRLAARRGKKRAAVAVAHAQLVTIYHMLRDGTEYKDLGADHFDNLAESRRTRQHVKALERMGYRVTVEKAA